MASKCPKVSSSAQFPGSQSKILPAFTDFNTGRFDLRSFINLRFFFFPSIRLKPIVALANGETIYAKLLAQQTIKAMDVLIIGIGKLLVALRCSNSRAINFPRRFAMAIYSPRERLQGIARLATTCTAPKKEPTVYLLEGNPSISTGIFFPRGKI